MKKTPLPKLSLHRETLRAITEGEAPRARGGVRLITAGDVCTLDCPLSEFCSS